MLWATEAIQHCSPLIRVPGYDSSLLDDDNVVVTGQYSATRIVFWLRVCGLEAKLIAKVYLKPSFIP